MSAVWTEAEKETLRRMANQQKTAAQIAEALGRSVDSIYRAASRFGVELQGQLLKSWSDEELDLLEEYWASGKSARQIGELLGRSCKAVDSMLTRAGLRDTQRPKVEVIVRRDPFIAAFYGPAHV